MSVDFYIFFTDDKASDSREQFRINHLGNFTDFNRNKHDSEYLYEFEELMKINNGIVNQDMIDSIYTFWDKLYLYVSNLNIHDPYYGDMIDEMTPANELKDILSQNIGKYIKYGWD